MNAEASKDVVHATSVNQQLGKPPMIGGILLVCCTDLSLNRLMTLRKSRCKKAFFLTASYDVLMEIMSDFICCEP